MRFSKELHEYVMLDDETIEDIRNDYRFAKEYDNSKEKDDYKIDI